MGLVVLALVGDGLLRPGAVDDRDGFFHVVLGVVPAEAEAAVARVHHAAAGAELQAAAAEHVEHGEVLGYAQRVVQRQDRHGATQAQAAGAGAERGEQHLRVGRQAAEVAEVVLGRPDGVEADGLRRLDLLEVAGVEVGRRAV